jgi:nucleoside-diphosphate kinase
MKFIQFSLATFLTISGFSALPSYEDSNKSCELVEQTLVIIKPEAVMDGNIGKIIQEFETGGMQIIGIRMVQLNQSEAKSFNEVFEKKNVNAEFIKNMSAGPIVVFVLEGRNAIAKAAKILGEPNPQAANKGTVREKYGQTLEKNAVYASNSIKHARKEILYFFTAGELYSPCARVVFKP